MIQSTWTWSRQPWQDQGNLDMIQSAYKENAANDCLNVGLVENEETERGSIKPLITPEIVDKIKKTV